MPLMSTLAWDSSVTIQGNWFAANSAAMLPAVLHVTEGSFSLVIAGRDEPLEGALSDLSVSSRLGNVERKIKLADGSVFATRDNDAVDTAFRGQNGAGGVIHAMESSWRWVALGLLVTVAVTLVFFRWGVPAISERIAHALPQKTNELIAGSTLDFLDKYVFEASTLDTERQEAIRANFAQRLIPLDDQNATINYTLHFRHWPDVPNALALPSGDIILTDAFVELADTQDQLDSVLLHEMGHIVHRHSLEMLIEIALVGTVVLLVTGDSNGIADMGIGLGTLLVSSHYSRHHETEADHYAFRKMLTAGIDPGAFARIMHKMSVSAKQRKETQKEPQKEPTEAPKERSISSYLASHPETEIRIRQAKQFSECFKRGERECELTLE